MSRLEFGVLCWRSPKTGECGEGSIEAMTHVDCEAFTKERENVIRHWLKGCTCDDCEAARGANDDEVRP